MKIFVIFPNQLYKNNEKFYEKYDQIIMYEHPYYFTRYKFNKKKLILHRSSMKYYFDEMAKKYKNKMMYIEYNDTKSYSNIINNAVKNGAKNGDEIDILFLEKRVSKKILYIFDPIDKIAGIEKFTILESPNFLLKSDDLAEYHNKTDKFFFYFFYMWAKKKLNIIPNVKSTDKENRHKIPSDLKLPTIDCDNNKNKKEAAYVKEAIEYVEKNFGNNYGDSEDFFYPITRFTARKWLIDFIKTKFANFGKYQDAIMDNDNVALFHSCLSSSINIGLLNPADIISVIALPKYRKKIPMNSYEGFIRQLFWREYQRYTYLYADFSGNYFKNTRALTAKWYTGSLGIEPVDNAIKKAFHYAYLHHIERLMVVGNYMNLSRIHPDSGYKWFMEFSIDSYSWVMGSNVYDMVFFRTGGLTTRKPYISSSNYILKMSNYKRGKWCDVWDKKYRAMRKKLPAKFLFY